jgi:hypothetical protein
MKSLIVVGSALTFAVCLAHALSAAPSARLWGC